MPRPLVVFTDDTVHPAGAERLAESCELIILKGSYPPEAELARVCAGADAIFARMGVVTRAVIEAAPRLKIIARHGIGVDAVDMAAATEHGILVTTTGSVNAGAVAEYTMALMMAFARKVAAADGGMRAGGWTREPLVGMELAGKTMGIVGLGAIGTMVARRAAAFDMTVLAADPFVTPPTGSAIEMTDIDDLVARADIVSLHMRLSEDTRRIIDARRIAAMKPTAILLNTARGELVEEPALVAALEAKRIGGAVLDVFEVEPLPDSSPLRTMDNVFLSPHVAGQTAESMRLVALAAADAILDTLAGRTPANLYNAEGLARAGKPLPTAAA